MWLNILRIFIHIPAGIIAFTLHGFVRAWASNVCGDSLSKERGRLSLNPVRHIEPIGLMCLAFFSLGWNKPVETRAFAYKIDRKKASIIVAVLPLAATLFVASLFGLLAHILAANVAFETMISNGGIRFLYDFLAAAAFNCLVFCLFNLLPVYPLDGYRLISILFPKAGQKIQSKEQIVQIAFMLLLVFGIIGSILFPVANSILGLL